MLPAMRGLMLFVAALLVIAAGVEEHIYSTGNSKHTSDSKLYRKSREIRNRESRVLHYDSDESQDSKKLLLLRNRPNEPLHDMYRKGFSHLHVPDFHRQAVVEERVPRKHSNQTIDDIISGIIHLLGGDVHVTRPETRPPSVIFPSSPKPSRINDRGPAHFDMYTRRERPPTTPSSFTSDSSSVIENKVESSSTNRWVFPDDTDVSLILGLINKTETESPAPSSVNLTSYLGVNTNFMDGGNVSSGHLEIVEIVPSAESGSHYTLPTTASENSEKQSTAQDTQITPTGVLTELDKNGHTFIETVINEKPVNDTHPPNIFLVPTHIRQFETTTRPPYINYTDLPILLPSRSTTTPQASTSKSSSTPFGPITDWLPVAKPPERSGNFTTSYIPHTDEPLIITHQPDNFEITVTRQMYTNESKSQPESIPTYTSLITPADVTSSTDISVSIVATQVDIIYGRPSVSSVLPPPPPSPPPSPPPTGRPQVYAVDITEVRPSKRPNVYTRPRPPDIIPPTFKNGLRPLPGARPSILRKPPIFRPQPPPQVPEIRIDTCVVGDDSTCDIQLKEHCRTERGVSACLCRPGYGRTVERGMCSPVVSMLLTLKVAKLGDKSIDPSHFVPGSPEYQRLNYEASHAMSTVFTYSPLAEAFRGSAVNRIYFIANRMVINSTVHLDESEVRGSLRHHVEHAVATAISRRDNRLGTSQLFINGPLSALVEVEDLNECGDKILNDCSEFAICDNLFGTFQCKCKPGYTDKFEGDPRNAGRLCSACSPDYCNGKGQCVVVQGRQECRCRGNYGGSRCQVDNEVIGVSVGVSVIAIIVIAITAACLYLWNRRWKRAHQKTEAAKHAGYRLQTMADHVRWGPASALGSTYVPSESTMQLSPPPLTPSASQLYAISNLQHIRHTQRNQLYEDDANPYGRIMRTLQKHNTMNHSGGLHYDTLNSECASSDEIGFPSVPSNSFVYHGTFPDRTSIYR